MTYHLPTRLRPELAAPFGPILDTAGALAAVGDRFLVSVGDVVTHTFLANRTLPHVMLVDGITKREKQVEDVSPLLPPGVSRVRVSNPAATITAALLEALESALRSPTSTLIEVIGEEDLAALPAMIMAPDGAAVCYGQPPGRSSEASADDLAARGGVVVVTVTPEVRQRAQAIFDRMEKR